MRKRQYCFSLRDGLNGSKLIGGTITAETMDEAAAKAEKSCKIEYVQEGEAPYTRHRHMYNGREVFLSITAHPEYTAR